MTTRQRQTVSQEQRETPVSELLQRAECAANIGPHDAEIRQLRHEIEMLTNASIIECAVRNKSVMEYMEHWETRCLKAEHELTAERSRREAAEKDAERLDWLERNHHFNGASEGGDFYRWEFSTKNNGKQWEPIRDKIDAIANLDAARSDKGER